MSAAWFCPACQKHHAPHVETCPAPDDPWGLRSLSNFTPTHLKPVYDPCAGCKGACGNVACPKLMVTTCGLVDGAVTTGGVQ